MNNRIDINMLMLMRSNTIDNYIIPGLSSSLIGSKSENGCVRLFENERDHQEEITPHSHRFDFQCLVLKGWVRNRIWRETKDPGDDEFAVSNLTYSGEVGKYNKEHLKTGFFKNNEHLINAGYSYKMRADEIHSIKFSRGAKVLFFEGKELTDTTFVLEPFVNGVCVPTFEVKDWMFSKRSSDREVGRQRMEEHSRLIMSEHGVGAKQ